VWAREPLLDADHFAPGTHSSTFSGTPLMLSVVDAVLDRFEDRSEWSSRIGSLEQALKAVVEDAAETVPSIVRSTTVLGGVARLRLRKPVAWAVRNAALELARNRPGESVGVLLASTGMTPDVIALHPPLTIEREDLAIVRDGLIRALQSQE
jgi:putrescine aminotransferase